MLFPRLNYVKLTLNLNNSIREDARGRSSAALANDEILSTINASETSLFFFAGAEQVSPFALHLWHFSPGH